ncbi:MAG: ABC transporter substrate-binding protein [Lachnospiraceae bacterium]|nr:ABC transporter substrate-binding protein [Lachnospiraceae bacterium]
MKTNKIRHIVALIAVAMIACLLVGCGKEDKEIYVMSFTNEVTGMVETYVKAKGLDKEGWTVKTNIVATDGGAYQTALDEALKAGGKEVPDIYGAEAAFVLKYTQGDFADFAGTYDNLGIKTTEEIKAAEIAKYAYEIGTRPSDGKIVALPYQSTGGAFIYNRDVAIATWGTDDPAEVAKKIGGGSGNWDQFWKAAEELKAKGFGIVSGDGDIWHPLENGSAKGWLVNGKLHIDPSRESLLDVSKKLKDNNYHNETQDWQEGWFADMAEIGPKKVLGFFGPAWLINYTMNEHSGDTAGRWGVTTSPVGFSWGGTWVVAGKNVADNKKAIVADIIRWITLDTTKEGLQYQWAMGTYNGGTGETKDTVCSNVVLKMANGETGFVGGQNMFEYFIPANVNARGDNMTQYDEKINNIWRDKVRAYVAGDLTRDQAIAEFKAQVKTDLGFDAE